MFNNKIKKIISICGISLLLTTGCNNTSNISSNSLNSDTTPIENNNTIKISAVGDVMVHTSQLEAQILDDNTYSFTNNFKYIKDIIENTDLAIANLETTINPERKYSGYPSFNSPIELIEALKYTGFDIISTINNHTLDTGYNGVLSTLKEIKSLGLKTVGTKNNEDEKNYIIEDVKGIKIGISSYSYGEIVNNQKYLNGISAGNANNLLNIMDSINTQKAFETLKKEIDLMREEGAEFIIMGLHWGKEYDQTPTSYQKELAQMLANEGVDVILGSHPHVVQPIEFLKSEINPEKETLVIYSMGNIISNQREEEMGFQKSENGILPIIEIEKDDNDEIEIKNVEYIPTWVNKETRNNKVIYEIIPIIEDISTLANKYSVSESDLEISYNDTTSLIQDEKVKIYKKDEL